MEDSSSEESCSCGECGLAIQETQRTPCPVCGSMRRIWQVTSRERIKIRESLKLDIRRQGFPSRKQPRISEFSGSEKRRVDGEWVTKTRLIDKEKDLYVEKVTLETTGEILRNVSESLSKHVGHGSAKKAATPMEKAKWQPTSDESAPSVDSEASGVVVLRAAWKGAVTADNAEAGFARIREITTSTLNDTALAQVVSDCVAQKLIHDPIRLPEGALHCHWTLELTAAGVAAARALIEK